MSDTVTNVVGAEEPGGIVYTIKGGAGFDAPWVVVRGGTPAEIVAQLVDLTGLPYFEHESAESIYDTPFEYLVAVDQHIKAVLAATGIGAPAQKSYGGSPQRGPARSQSFAAKSPTGGDAATSASTEPAKPAHEFQEYLDLIEDATTMGDIGKAFAKDKRDNGGKAWKNADVAKAAEAKAGSFS